MKILNIGSCNIDYVYKLDHIVTEGETEHVAELNIFAGGKGLNQSVAAAKAGAEVWHAGCIGENGAMLIETLSQNNVNTSLIMRSKEKNGHAIIQVNKSGENSIFVYPGTNEMIDKNHIDYVISHFEKGDFLMLQNEINNVDYIIKKAYEKGLKIILNPSPINEKLKETDLNKISYLILNELEAKNLFKGNDAQACLFNAERLYPKLCIVLTLGINGSLYKSANEMFHQNAYKTNVVDTTAAGDTFMGYFAAGLTKNIPIRENLKTASAASAITVSRNGASPSIPLYHEVADNIKNMTEMNFNFDDVKLKRLIDEYIADNLKSASIDGLAKKLNCSYHTARNTAKRITGKSFTEYVIQKRLTSAVKLLKETNMPISEIIESTGYENESYFRRKFKEYYGKSPNKLRKSGGK